MSVDRYIKNFEVDRGLAQRFSSEKIPQLARIQPCVVSEYLAILEEHDLTNHFLSSTNDDCASNPVTAGLVSVPALTDYLGAEIMALLRFSYAQSIQKRQSPVYNLNITT